jgi:DNA-binding protein YbaB
MLKYKFINVDDDDLEMQEVRKEIERFMELKNTQLSKIVCVAQLPDESITVTVNIKGELTDIGINREMLSPENKIDIEDALIVLTNEAIKRADEVFADFQKEVMEAIEDITEGKIDVRKISSSELLETEEKQQEEVVCKTNNKLN